MKRQLFSLRILLPINEFPRHNIKSCSMSSILLGRIATSSLGVVFLLVVHIFILFVIHVLPFLASRSLHLFRLLSDWLLGCTESLSTLLVAIMLAVILALIVTTRLLASQRDAEHKVCHCLPSNAQLKHAYQILFAPFSHKHLSRRLK